MATLPVVSRLLTLAAAVAVAATACGDVDDRRAATTTTSALTAPGLGLDRPILVADADGVAQIGTDGRVSRLVAGTVAVAVDDTRGGLLYQVRSGRLAEAGDRATVVWWIPHETGAPQELLVPAPASGHRLTLHDAYPTAEGFAVLYTRHETEPPVDERADSLRRFDVPDRVVTEILSLSAFEQALGDVSAGGDRIGGTTADQVSSSCFITDLDGRPIDLVPRAAADPSRETYVTGCRLSPDGTRLAFVTADARGATVALWRLGEGEEARFGVPAGNGRVLAIDLSEDRLLVNVDRDGPLPALVFDLAAPDAAPERLPVAGMARFADDDVDIGAQVGSRAR